jgi:hypothetical protein
MHESQLAYSYAPVGYEKLAQIPTLAREDAIFEHKMPRYVIIEGQAIKVRRGGGRDYYFRFDTNLLRNVVTYINPDELIIYICDNDL